MKIVTHSGNFHTDEIFAVAVLLMMYPEAEIIRSREQDVIDVADIVVDVGGIHDVEKSRFDHHQPGGAGKRENGIPYASFGLVWKEFGEKLAGSAEARNIIDERLAMPIDAIDNGVRIAEYIYPGVREFGIGDFLYSFLDPENTDPKYLYEVFMKDVEIARELLKRECAYAKKEAEDTQEVLKLIPTMEDKRILILPRAMSWFRAVNQAPEVLFAVYPRKEGSWGAKAARKNLVGLESRKLFPEAWAGKGGEELIALTGVPDAIFAHKERFLAGATSREGALKLAQIAVNA